MSIAAKRSKMALLFTMRSMFEGRKRGYFWTFTFVGVLDVKMATRAWTRFLNDHLRRKLKFEGLRAFEMHPDGHGLHIHVVTVKRYNIVDVLALIAGSQFAGVFGRVNVKWFPVERLEYLAKYVGKSQREPCFKGVRVWASFGVAAAVRSRVKDVVYDSIMSRMVKDIFSEGRASVLGFAQSRCLQWEAFKVCIEHYVLGCESQRYRVAAGFPF